MFIHVINNELLIFYTVIKKSNQKHNIHDIVCKFHLTKK